MTTRSPATVSAGEISNSVLINIISHSTRVITEMIVLSVAGMGIAYRRVPNTFLLSQSLEGVLQHSSALYFFKGRKTTHGAFIPIKKFRWNEYTSYTSTWPLIVFRSNGAIRVYAPYKGGYVPAEVTSDGIVLYPEREYKRLNDFISWRVDIRGAFFDIFYDYLRLGRKPPRSVRIGGESFKFEYARGPLKIMYQRIPVLEASIMYVYATVEDIPPHIIDVLLKRYPGGWGWKKSGVLLAYHRDIVGRWEPEKILFARVAGRDEYVLLRPLPVSMFKHEDVVWDPILSVVCARRHPPYFLKPGFRKEPHCEPHYIPGTVVRRVPDGIEWVR